MRQQFIRALYAIRRVTNRVPLLVALGIFLLLMITYLVLPRSWYKDELGDFLDETGERWYPEIFRSI